MNLKSFLLVWITLLVVPAYPQATADQNRAAQDLPSAPAPQSAESNHIEGRSKSLPIGW